MQLEIDTERIIQGFHACTLPKEEWTHLAHLIVGLHTVRHHGLAESFGLMRSGIKRYNLSVGGENSDHAGYHETITIFFCHALDAFVQSKSGSLDFSDLVSQLQHSKLVEHPFMFKFYRRETLFSVHARRHWVEPDQKPLAEISDLF